MAARKTAAKKKVRKSPTKVSPEKPRKLRDVFATARAKVAAEQVPADHWPGAKGNESWIPPKMVDEIADAVARNPKGGLSLSMEELLHPKSERRIVVLKAATGSISNTAEFVGKMAEFGVEVILLEFNPYIGINPQLEWDKK
jgi:hypothetical protein